MRLRASEWVLGTWLGVLVLACVAAGETPNLARTGAVQPLLALIFGCALVLAVLLVADGLRASGAALRAFRSGAPWPPEAGFQRECQRLQAAGLRPWFVLAAAAFTYPLSEFAIEALRGRATLDKPLAALDLWLFGAHASVALERFVTPERTALLRAAYFSHLLVPPFILTWFALKRPRAEFVRLVDEFVTLSLLGTLGYLLVPAAGPYRELASHYSVPLSGGPLSTWSAAAIEALRVPRDAFPSLHVALSGLCLWRVREASRGLALVFLPLVVGNWAGTLYLRYHYTIDVVAGLVLIPCVIHACRWLAPAVPLSPCPPSAAVPAPAE